MMVLYHKRVESLLFDSINFKELQFEKKGYKKDW